MSRRHWNSPWPARGPSGSLELPRWRRPMGVTSCLQVQLLPLLDSETTPDGSKSCFQDQHTEAHSAAHWCDSQLPSVGTQGRGRCGSWCSTFPEQRLPPPPSMSWSRWVTGVPGESPPECAGGAIHIIVFRWTLTCWGTSPQEAKPERAS